MTLSLTLSLTAATLTAATLLAGCSHSEFDSNDERFPAPAVVEQKQLPKVHVFKVSVDRQHRQAEKAARPAPGLDKEAMAAESGKQNRTAKAAKTATSNDTPEAVTPASEPRALSMGRRADQDLAGLGSKPLAAIPPKPQQPSIGAVIEQSELNLRIGNITVARAVLEPFVKAKHPEALAELGKTYDPIELEKFLVPPGTSDTAKALELYTEAARLGSLVGKIRLDRLKAVPVSVEKQR